MKAVVVDIDLARKVVISNVPFRGAAEVAGNWESPEFKSVELAARFREALVMEIVRGPGAKSELKTVTVAQHGTMLFNVHGQVRGGVFEVHSIEPAMPPPMEQIVKAIEAGTVPGIPTTVAIRR